jgi:hypothetical protein
MKVTNAKHFKQQAEQTGFYGAQYSAANTNHVALLAIGGGGGGNLTSAPAFKI